MVTMILYTLKFTPDYWTKSDKYIVWRVWEEDSYNKGDIKWVYKCKIIAFTGKKIMLQNNFSLSLCLAHTRAYANTTLIHKNSIIENVFSWKYNHSNADLAVIWVKPVITYIPVITGSRAGEWAGRLFLCLFVLCHIETIWLLFDIVFNTNDIEFKGFQGHLLRACVLVYCYDRERV